MKRREALAALWASALAGCGGGGSADAAGATPVANSAPTPSPAPSPPSPSPSPAPAPAPAPAPGPTLAGKNIALWGDSIPNLTAAALQALYPQRQVFNGGVVGQTSDQVKQRVLADTSHKDWISIFWCGHNDFFKDQVPPNIAACIASLPAGSNFIVVSLLTWAGIDLPGTATYNAVLQTNLKLAQQYPDNYIDMRSWLVSRYNPSLPQDVIDHNNDQVPTSLRFDQIHPNDAGTQVIAARLRDFISAKGW